jgi:N-acetylmuramic acid 6-phosphate etherase
MSRYASPNAGGPEPHTWPTVDAPTERRNPDTTDLDLLATLDLLRRINAHDSVVPTAVAHTLPSLARAVDLAVEALAGGHRVHYFGAGTSGRVAAMDAAEITPTFGLPPGTVVAHQAGGSRALAGALEDVEDDAASGREEAEDVDEGDLVLGLTASGRTPYVAGALEAARARGAGTVLVSANPKAELASLADLHVCVETGPEVLAGSTRMKAGTAQKLVLNAFSTATMVRLGRTYSNLMTSLVAKNSKLHGRMVRILAEASGQDPQTCARVLGDCDGNLKLALVRLLGQVDGERALNALAANGGHVRAALRTLDGGPPGPGEEPHAAR